VADLKLYLQNVAADYMPATHRGAWDVHALNYPRKLATTKSGAIDYNTIACGSTSAGTDVLNFHGSYILPTSMDFSSGAVTGCIGQLESNAGLNAYLHLHVWIAEGQSDTVRCTLVTDYIDAEEFGTTSTTCGEAYATTAAASRIGYAGDVLCVEIGYQSASTSTAYTGRAYYGGTGNDLTDNGNPTASLVGWINLVYSAVAAGTGTQINIGDAWKTATAAQINIGDTWKAVTGIQVNIGDAWKRVM
jgi:hypothetical protein